jgi:hypothetical protein
LRGRFAQRLTRSANDRLEPDKLHAITKSLELLIERTTPELSEHPAPHHHEKLCGLGPQLENLVDDSRKIVDRRGGGLVLAQRLAAQVLLIDGREEERCGRK